MNRSIALLCVSVALWLGACDSNRNSEPLDANVKDQNPGQDGAKAEDTPDFGPEDGTQSPTTGHSLLFGSGGGGTTVSESGRAYISIGAPTPSGKTKNGNYTVQIQFGHLL